MLKRLIEVALPLKEVSEQSAREKSIRHGHISTLHIWWARRPLAACRAVVFASLIPDPDDPECPESFRKLVMEQLNRSEFKPRNGDGTAVEDSPRNRCLEFIKHLVKWENSNNPEYIEPARNLVTAAHRFLHPDAEGDVPKVLDPFAGGGAIPLEALRLGCETIAVDLNPVAHLIELCTLVYPQKYGRPDSGSVPVYIKRLVAHNRAEKRAKAGPTLFEREGGGAATADADGVIPDVEITEAEYRENPLAADVKYWGYWVLKAAHREIGEVYPSEEDGSIPVAYLWARTVPSPDPTTKAVIPLIRQLWLCKKPGRSVALQFEPNSITGQCDFTVAEGAIFARDPDAGTVRRGDAICPFTGTIAPVEYLRQQARSGRMGQQMLAVVSVRPGSSGKQYRAIREGDVAAFRKAGRLLADAVSRAGADALPNEPLPPVGTLGFRVNNYGLTKWSDLFNPRQLLALLTLTSVVERAGGCLRMSHDAEYATAVSSYLGVAVSRFSDFNSSLCTWNYTGGRGVGHTFTRQAVPMVWDYPESMPFNPQGANWQACVDAATDVVRKLWHGPTADVRRGSAAAIPAEDGAFSAIVTDPPYYDAVPYSDLSDYFYVWMKRTLLRWHPETFRTPLTPKKQEIISYGRSGKRSKEKPPAWYEARMREAFREAQRVLNDRGVAAVMFAHKETTAWETLIGGLLGAGLIVSASWPLHTERPGRMRAQDSAALASSVTLVCRRRRIATGTGLWDDVRKELQQVAKERLDFFWSQGIRGADFFISAIGPALSVFGKYERVTKLSGDEVTVGQFLDEVRSLVTGYALTKILKTTHTGAIDPESRFYVVWKWSYGDAKVPADESFKLAQALGMDTDLLWDKTGVLEKLGENVLATPISKRLKIRNLGDHAADGTPASLIDVLHRMCAFREKGDTQGMAQFLNRSGHANNHSLWLIAQAVSEILPDGDKEKQLMQGLLNQKEGLVDATRQGTLF